jgi:hypothetical protein
VTTTYCIVYNVSTYAIVVDVEKGNVVFPSEFAAACEETVSGPVSRTELVVVNPDHIGPQSSLSAQAAKRRWEQLSTGNVPAPDPQPVQPEDVEESSDYDDPVTASVVSGKPAASKAK